MDRDDQRNALIDRWDREYGPWIIRELTKAGASIEQAEDAKQQALATACRVGSNRPHTSVRRWLLTIALRHFYEESTWQGRQRTMKEALRESGRTRIAPDPFDDAVRSDFGELLSTALEKLPLSQMQVVVLCYFYGLSHAEIAAKLNTTEDGSRRRLQRAMDNLRKQLSGLEADILP